MKKLSLFVVLGVLLGTLTAGTALADPAAQAATINYTLARVCSDTDEFQFYVSVTAPVDFWAEMWIYSAQMTFVDMTLTPQVLANQTGYLSVEWTASPDLTEGSEFVVEVWVYDWWTLSSLVTDTHTVVAAPCYGAAAAGVDAMAAWRDNNIFMNLTDFGAPVRFNGVFMMGGAVTQFDLGGAFYEVGYWNDGAYVPLGWFDAEGNVAADPDGPLTDEEFNTLLDYLGW